MSHEVDLIFAITAPDDSSLTVATLGARAEQKAMLTIVDSDKTPEGSSFPLKPKIARHIAAKLVEWANAAEELS